MFDHKASSASGVFALDSRYKHARLSRLGLVQIRLQLRLEQSHGFEHRIAALRFFAVYSAYRESDVNHYVVTDGGFGNKVEACLTRDSTELDAPHTYAVMFLLAQNPSGNR